MDRAGDFGRSRVGLMGSTAGRGTSDGTSNDEGRRSLFHSGWILFLGGVAKALTTSDMRRGFVGREFLKALPGTLCD